MCHALRAARLMPEFLAAIEVVLVETSPVLADAQKDALKSCDVPVRWVQSVDTLAQDRAQFTIANEFLDVLPVQQFVFTGKGWCERMVGLDADGTLTLALAPSASPIAVSSERGQPSIGAIYEVSRAAIAIVEDIARGIATCGGAALFIDYGYDGRGFGETLQAVGANQFRDVLATPGSVDISAHVDFGAMARAAEVGGAKAYGPVSQGALLESLGIGNHAGARAATSAVDRLTSADQMGTLFKALAIVSPPAATPPGFEE
jgi:SAM-dependent MidA family methyltransferase